MFSFEGRLRRREYWPRSILAHIAIYAIVFGLPRWNDPLTVLLVPALVLSLWVAYAASVTRWRDTGNSLWWLVPLLFAQLIGLIIIGVWPSDDKELRASTRRATRNP